MLGVNRVAELATALLHIGGLSGAAAHMAANDPSGAIGISVVASMCVLILTGAVVLAEIAKVKVRQYVRKHEQHTKTPKPRDKEDQDA
jgi:hypothetical protein